MQGNNQNNPGFTYVNGVFLDKGDAVISVEERGFRFGDGVFETIRVCKGALYQYDLHLSRLKRGLEAIRIVYDVSQLAGICQELLVKNKIDEGIIRISVSRGMGSIGYLPIGKREPTVVIEANPLSEPENKPVDIWVSSLQKVSPSALPVQYKTMQGLNQTLARMEAVDQQCFEAIMLDSNGRICEGSSANIFWYKKGILYTPSIELGVLEGTIREAVKRLSPYKVEEGGYGLEYLETAEEVFLTNVAWLALPVKSIKPLGKTYTQCSVGEEIRELLLKDIYASAERD